MSSSAGFAVRYAGEAVAFTAGWLVLGAAFWALYVWAQRVADRRRERELRAILVMGGRFARVYGDRCWALYRERDARMARTFADGRAAVLAAIAADEAARDARAVAKLRRDLGPSRRPPLVAVPDAIDEAV